MTAERPVAAARARALPESVAPPDPRQPGSGPSDTGPPGGGASGPGPADARALIRTQLRIALGTCAIVMAVVTGLPVLLAAVPAIARARVHGVPLWWLVLALGVQPLWIAVSRWQLIRAERAERDLARPVDRP